MMPYYSIKPVKERSEVWNVTNLQSELVQAPIVFSKCLLAQNDSIVSSMNSQNHRTGKGKLRLPFLTVHTFPSMGQQLSAHKSLANPTMWFLEIGDPSITEGLDMSQTKSKVSETTVLSLSTPDFSGQIRAHHNALKEWSTRAFLES